MTKFPTINEILTNLINKESISPQDASCQQYMINLLESIGFTCQIFNKNNVSNFYAHYGSGDSLIVFAGHTDVVDCGNISLWNSNPFQLHERDGFYYGRGVADMKGSLACMLVAAQEFIQQNETKNISIGFIITSGEEGDDFNDGTPYVMEQLSKQGIKIQYCIVGEPSSDNHVGDVIKIGRRGSLNAHLTLHGKQGHVAYPHLAINPIHKIIPLLNDLSERVWDHGYCEFPPTSLQITYISTDCNANNIIPGQVECKFNIRYSTKHTFQSLQNEVENYCQKHNLTPDIKWQLSGEPFLTQKGTLLKATIEAIKNITHKIPELSTGGGTSDGRFIAPYGVDVIELGPVNKTIHQINESVSIADLSILKDIYLKILCYVEEPPKVGVLS